MNLLVQFRETFDVMTFFKPIGVVVEEEKKFPNSLFLILVSIFLVALVSVPLLLLQNNGNFSDLAFKKLFSLAFLFIGIIIHVSISTLVVFLVSRVFSKEGNLQKAVSTNFFIVSAATPFLLVLLIPFAEFAGYLFFVLGVILYFYFVEEAQEKIYGLSEVKSLLLVLFYVLLTCSIFFGLFTIATIAGLSSFLPF